MPAQQPESLSLHAFYQEAKVALEEIATKHGLTVPLGHVAFEESTLHWRFSVYTGQPETYWADLWIENATKLGLGILIEPGDRVLDQEGRSWTLLGLDPSSLAYPVRLLDMSGAGHVASVEAAQLFQVLKKAQAEPDFLESETD